MKKLLILFLISSEILFGQIIVNQKNDPRLLSYTDSMRSFVSGLKQLQIAIQIKNKKDTTEGRIARSKIEALRMELNPKIKPVCKLDLYTFIHKIYQDTTSIWIPELYKKPVQVIYEPIVLKEEKKIVKNNIIAYSPIVKQEPDTIKQKVKRHKYIYVIGNREVTREEFEKIYDIKIK